MSKVRQNISRSAQKVISQRDKDLSQWSSSKFGLLVVLLTIVCAMVLAAHWPVLSAQALLFDDDQYLINNLLVQNPGWPCQPGGTSSRRQVSLMLNLRQRSPLIDSSFRYSQTTSAFARTSTFFDF